MFGVQVSDSTGFDIVIGNPPYIQLQKNHGELAKLNRDKGYQTFDSMGDIYCLFYERGMQLLAPGGHLCFITSNKWMRAGYGEKLRAFFTKHNPKILVDLGPGIFESATVDTNILLIEKLPETSASRRHSAMVRNGRNGEPQNTFQLRAVTLQRTNEAPVDIAQQVDERGVVLTTLTQNAWFIGSSAEQRLKEKIERIGKPLKEWDVKIYYGIKTGLNEAFIITTEKRNEILANCSVSASSRIDGKTERERTEAIIKPILRGRDIKRYYYEWAGLWVIVIPAGWTNENRGKQSPEKFVNSVFSSLMNYLKPFEKKARRRDDQGDYWWELRHCAYYPEFEKEKVVWKALSLEPSFALVPPGFFNNDKANLLTSKNNDTRYLCALMNSKIFQFYFSSIGIDMGEGFEYKIQFVEKSLFLPSLPPTSPL